MVGKSIKNFVSVVFSTVSVYCWSSTVSIDHFHSLYSQNICFIFKISGENSEKQLTLKSAEVILMSIFDERKARDVKLHKQILPACRFLKVTGVRGHSKPTVTKRLAKAFIDRRYVVISSQNLANLQIEDVQICPDKDIRQDLKDLSLSKQDRV